MRKFICVFLVVLFCFSLSSCGASDAEMLQKYDFYNANIGDSFDDIKNIKGIEFYGESLKVNPKDVPRSKVDAMGKFFELDSDFYYSFENNKLYEFGIHSTLIRNPEFKGDKATETVNKIIAELDKIYGEPEITDWENQEDEERINIARDYESENIKVRIMYCRVKDNSYTDMQLRFRKK